MFTNVVSVYILFIFIFVYIFKQICLQIGHMIKYLLTKFHIHVRVGQAR